MTWLKSGNAAPLSHECLPPVRTKYHVSLPMRPPYEAVIRSAEVVLEHPGGALWQCDCGALWIVRRRPVYEPGTNREVGSTRQWEKLSPLAAWWEKRKTRNIQTGG